MLKSEFGKVESVCTVLHTWKANKLLFSELYCAGIFCRHRRFERTKTRQNRLTRVWKTENRLSFTRTEIRATEEAAIESTCIGRCRSTTITLSLSIIEVRASTSRWSVNSQPYLQCVYVLCRFRWFLARASGWRGCCDGRNRGHQLGYAA
jgi:hypothetical protein